MKKCKETVTPSDAWGSFHRHQCSRNAVKDGYCKQHHPDEVKKRREESGRRWQEKQKRTPGYKLMLAIEKIKKLEKEIVRLKKKLKKEK